ncbi:MAG: HAD family phosphatase [Anaerolineae bacterium]|nr:HAD family phosphatase [Anaerolineae bacterium]
MGEAGRFEGLIFDFNGVLWWDGALQERAWQRFARRLRGSPLSDAEMACHVHGRHNRHTLSYLLGRPVGEEEAERLGEEKEVIYRALCLEQGEAFCLSPGARPLLDFLAAGGIPRTIATASGAGNVDFFVAQLDLGRWFDLSLVVYDDGTRPGKPAPDTYLEAARRLALPPARCVVVEDSRSGIEAAQAAGIGCVVGLGPAPLAGTDLTIPALEAFPLSVLLAPAV